MSTTRPAAADLRALDEVALTATRYEDLVAGVERAVGPVLGAASCGVMLWEGTPDVLQMLPGSFGAPEPVTASYRVSTEDTRSNAARVFATGDTFVTNDARADRRVLQDYAEAFGIVRLLSTALGAGGRRVGVLHLANPGRDFDDADVRTVGLLVGRVAVAVEQVRRLTLLRRKERLGTVLGRVAERVAAGRDADDILPPALRELVRLLGARRLALTVEGAAPVLAGAVPQEGRLDREFLEAHRLPSVGVAEVVARPTRAGDPGSSALHVPVVVAERRIGSLSLLRTRAEPLSRDERAALVRLADLVALAWTTEHFEAQRATAARLRERERIADDLHDQVAQILFGSRAALEAVLGTPGLQATHRAGVERASALLSRGEVAIREVIEELSVGTTGPLAARLEGLVRELTARYAITGRVVLPDGGLPAAADDPPVADLVCRVCHEALVNAAKHAGPGPVDVVLGARLADDGRLVVSVADDGPGPPPRARPTGPGGHGLPALRRAVRERGGALRVARRRGGGTVLTARIDLRHVS